MKVMFPLKTFELREMDGIGLMKANNSTKPNANK
jgi:hypothetical protein